MARTLNEMAAGLESLFDARRELVAWASHDLRTPVASMQAMLEAIEDGLATPEQYLPALQQQVRTLAMLVDDLFELARIDAGSLTLELREAELRGLVDSCLRGIEAEAHIAKAAASRAGGRIGRAPRRVSAEHRESGVATPVGCGQHGGGATDSLPAPPP